MKVSKPDMFGISVAHIDYTTQHEKEVFVFFISRVEPLVINCPDIETAQKLITDLKDQMRALYQNPPSPLH